MSLFSLVASKQARRVPPYQATSDVQPMPAPVGGWNTRDPIASMDPTDAITLDNFLTDTGAVRVRPGSALQGTSPLDGRINTLMEYAPPTGSNKLLAVSSAGIADMSVISTASAVFTTAFTNARFQHVNFATSGGHFLVAVNGADNAITYDGSTVATCSIVGVSASNLGNIAIHGQRLWFTENDKNSAWYLATRAIAATATEFPLSSLAKRGGYLLAIGSWTLDGGDGQDDLLCFFTSKGEVLVYRGTDPTDAANFALQGIYNIPEPIGRRCLVKVGADLAVLTSLGLVPLSKILSAPSSLAKQVAFTDKISPSFRTAFLASGTAFGWQVLEYPQRNLMIVNRPVTEAVQTEQFAMNTQTGAWSRFKGMNADCWSQFNNKLYFVFANNVYRWDSGFRDPNGTSITEAITVSVQTAYAGFGSQRYKRFVRARPFFSGSAVFTITPQITVRTDFDTTAVSPAGVASSPSGSLWDQSTWDVSLWASATNQKTVQWQDTAGEGVFASIAFAASPSEDLIYHGSDVMFETGDHI